MQDLWTNRSSLRDFVINGMRRNCADVSEIYIAVAFFTEEKVVKEFLANNCHVRMVVRLGYPTRPEALRALINNPNIEIRYYSDQSFHPKLYIFGSKLAFVGSANLTVSALQTNQEVVVSIDSEDPRFNELKSLFLDYWSEAQVLTSESIASYETIYEKYSQSRKEISLIDEEIQLKIGKTVFPNIDRGAPKKAKEKIFLDEYRKTYQECVTAFEKIKEVYMSVGTRKNDFDDIPIRIEIDSFISFVRERHAKSESWKEQPIGWSENRRTLVQEHIREWLNTDWPHYDETICYENYPRIRKSFGFEENIINASYDEIIDALSVLHSFYDRLRFFPGGFDTLMNKFKTSNDIKDTKSSLIHLLYGKGDIVERMADLIYTSSYKLVEFGQSNVQELVGWIYKEELPVINGRTTKVFRYYGFDVRQL